MDSMFCYQCEQTIGGKGCTRVGNCGKDADVAALQDLLIYELKGIGYLGHKLILDGEKIPDDVNHFVTNALFSTLTNVNFDEERFFGLLEDADNIKNSLKKKAGIKKASKPQVEYSLPSTKEEILKDAKEVGIKKDSTINEDIRSLRELLIYGMKGMAAYAHQAAVLGFCDEEVYNFFYKGLSKTIDNSEGVKDLIDLNMEFGRVNYKCMDILDKANTNSFKNPEATETLVTYKKGPFIIVSGHDLKDLFDLLEQTKNKGINIYTHGEMLPANAYPKLKKYPHLIGNFGGAWQDQVKEFKDLKGCILMTTNCLQKPDESYFDRIFTTSVVGWPGVKRIKQKNGVNDYTEIIDKALELCGFDEDQTPEKKILIGFGHNEVLKNAEAIISAVKDRKIRHFFLVGGCDGAKTGRNYYTEFAEKAPKDTIIMTLACGKYRFNKLDFGQIGDIPRLLDIGQCNDSYSAIKIALALSDAFNCNINDLPLTLVLSWYEQKAVCVLLTLLSLGIKNIYLGPTLPAFLSPNVLQYLIDNFNLKQISTVEEDLKVMLGEKQI